MTCAGLLLVLATAAHAGEADELLGKVDAAAARGDDLHLELAVTTEDARGRTAERALHIWQKGEDQRRVEFTEPARLKGIAMLVPDGETVYLYLPAYGRPRRVVGESRGDAFVGTDFAMDDLSRLSWASEYQPELLGPNELRLTPREGKSPASPRVELTVRPEDHLPTLVEHFDDEGTLVRRIRFEDFQTVDERALAHTVTVEDVARSRTTRATVTKAAFDRGISDDLFSLTTLSR